MTIKDIKYSMDPSAFFLFWILSLYSFSAATKAFPASTMCTLITLLMPIVLMICLLLHEAGHAYTAVGLGVPITGIKLMALGGIATMGKRPQRARHEFLISIAGPIVSVILWFLFSLPEYLGVHTKLTLLLKHIGTFNAIITIFNMVPAFPLDGGRVFRSIMWGITGNVRKATDFAVLVSCVIAAIYFFNAVINIDKVGFGIIWVALICLFVILAGQAERQYLKKESLGGMDEI